MKIDNNSLIHWGILGMKWGVRRSRSPGSSDHIKAKSLKGKRLKDMTNEEIRQLTTRIQLERQYNDLNPNSIARGKAKVGLVIDVIGKITTTAATITAAYNLGKKIYSSPFGKKIQSSPFGKVILEKAKKLS